MFDNKTLDLILAGTIQSTEKGKLQIYEIAEAARTQMALNQEELDEVNKSLTLLKTCVDNLTETGKEARARLAEVKKEFSRFSEKEIQEAYNQELQFQTDLIRFKESIKLLKYKQEQLESGVGEMQATAARAERLVSRIGVMLGFLGNGSTELLKIDTFQQAQQMAISIIRAQEEERKRVAREIHDGPAQSMANIVMRAEFCLKLLELSPDRVKEELISLQQLVRLSLQDVRKIIFDLRPMVLDDLGLAPALKRYLSEYREQYGLPVDFQFFGKQRRLDSSIEVALFRIVQEAINNSNKHAKATSAVVKMEMGEDRLNIFVRDNGIGFNLDQTVAGSKGRGYGLLGIRERVQLLNGELEVTSAPGQGTSISISIPISQ